jgi:hypothetical protein
MSTEPKMKMCRDAVRLLFERVSTMPLTDFAVDHALPVISPVGKSVGLLYLQIVPEPKGTEPSFENLLVKYKDKSTKPYQIKTITFGELAKMDVFTGGAVIPKGASPLSLFSVSFENVTDQWRYSTVVFNLEDLRKCLEGGKKKSSSAGKPISLGYLKGIPRYESPESSPLREQYSSSERPESPDYGTDPGYLSQSSIEYSPPKNSPGKSKVSEESPLSQPFFLSSPEKYQRSPDYEPISPYKSLSPKTIDFGIPSQEEREERIMSGSETESPSDTEEQVASPQLSQSSQSSQSSPIPASQGLPYIPSGRGTSWYRGGSVRSPSDRQRRLF